MTRPRVDYSPRVSGYIIDITSSMIRDRSINQTVVLGQPRDQLIDLSPSSNFHILLEYERRSFFSRNVEMMQQPIPITDKTIPSVATIKCLLSTTMNQWNAYRSNSLTLVSSAMVDVRSSEHTSRDACIPIVTVSLKQLEFT